MDERDWLLLKRLHEMRNFTKAAESMMLSQPAFSVRLQKIEERFDTQLVVRVKRSFYFTPVGEYMVACANEVLSKIDSIEEFIQANKNIVKGTLKIGSSTHSNRHNLPELLKQFNSRYPDVLFKMVSGKSEQIVDMISRHEIDIGFVLGDHDWSGEKTLLLEENLLIVSAQEINLETLPDVPRIDYICNKAVRQLLGNWWRQNFDKPAFVGMEVDHISACKDMVSNGLGYAFLPDTVLSENDKLFKIKMVDEEGKPLKRRIWMYYHRENTQMALTKTFIDFVNSWSGVSL